MSTKIFVEVSLQRNLDYNGSPQQTIANQRTQKKFQSKKQTQSKFKSSTRLTMKELFHFLNLWDVEPDIKQQYYYQFRNYLEKKMQNISIEELQKTMKKPDFIRFFKYIKEPKEKIELPSDDEENSDPFGYLSATRRRINKKEPYKIKQQEKTIQQKPKNSIQSMKRTLNPNEQIPSATPEDFIIVQHFFQNIIDNEGTNSIEKDIVVNLLLDNNKFCEAYELNKFTLEYRLKNYPTSNNETITMDEFINFILYPTHVMILRQPEDWSKATSEIGDFDGVSIITEELLQACHKVYVDIDIYQNEQVEALKFAKCLRVTYETKIHLLDAVVNLQSIERQITFEKFLQQFEYQTTLNDSKITFNQFKNEITNYKIKPAPRKHVVIQSKMLGNNYFDQNESYILPGMFFVQLEKIFFDNCHLKFNAYAKLSELLLQARTTDDFLQFFKFEVRKKETNQLPIETVEQTLERMEQEMTNYLDFDEAVDFFTLRGRPYFLSEKLKKQFSTNNKMDEQKIKQELQNREKKEQIFGKEYGAINKINAQEFYITIPFNNRFNEEEENKKKTIRQKQVERMLKEKIYEEDRELNYSFKAKPVPWYVSEPLYDKINREKEENRERLKDEIKKRMLEDSKSLYSFEKLAKAKESQQKIYAQDDFIFKARPIPHDSSVLLYDQLLEEKKQQSLQNIERRKQELLDMIDMPGGIKNMFERLEELKIKRSMSPYNKKHMHSSGDSFSGFHAKNMPDFERLHQEFENELIQKKKQFEPTVPYETNLLNVNMKPPDYGFLNQVKENKQEKIAEIDRKLQKILNISPTQHYGTRNHENLVDYRRKQKYNAYMKKENEENERAQMKKERRNLLPKGLNAVGDEIDYIKVSKEAVQQQVRWKKQFHKDLEKDYKQEQKEMARRVRKRPLLRHTINKDVYIDDSSSSEKQITDNSNTDYSKRSKKNQNKSDYSDAE